MKLIACHFFFRFYFCNGIYKIYILQNDFFFTMNQNVVSINAEMQLLLEIFVFPVQGQPRKNCFMQSQRLQEIGEKVGFQLTERLLHREKFTLYTPEKMVLFLASTLWRSLFGRAICYACTAENRYIIRDQNFKWGSRDEYFRHNALLRSNHVPLVENELPATLENSPFSEFLSGIIRGSLLFLSPYLLPSALCEITNSKEVNVLLDFSGP